MKSLPLIAMIICLVCSSCIKQQDPCHGAKHIQADFTMQETCTGQSCGPLWQNYTTSYSSGSWIQFTSTSTYNTSLISSDTPTYEWHIGAGIYYSASFTLNFGSAPNGAIIPVMLIIRQKPDSLCIPNDNGVDTIVKNLTIDQTTKFCYGSWQGTFADNPTQTKIVNIKKYYSQINNDTFFYISNLEPPYDSVVGSTTQFMTRQEIPFVIRGNGTLNFYGAAITDSIDQNIQINYQYLDTPSYTVLITKTFKGIKL